jgi:nucleoid-associated protein YgaU
VSVTQKLFVATLLIVAGFGVARFLGKPNAFTRSLHESAAPYAAQAADHPAPDRARTVSAPSDSSFTLGGARLLPEPVAAPTDAPVPPVALEAPSLSRITPAQSPLPSTPALPPLRDSLASVSPSLSPRATLRNEAPRPVGIEPRSPATIRRAPPVDATSIPAQSDNAVTSAGQWSTAPAFNPYGPEVGASDDTNPLGSALQASYSAPVEPGVRPPDVSPPPWPAPSEEDSPRRHVIVDGDSLARLAARYLDDPHRANEIFELNREVLSDPELLPIGTELTLPPRSGSTGQDRQGRPGSGSIHEAANNRLVPLRPLTSGGGLPPRAQLSGPLPIVEKTDH